MVSGKSVNFGFVATAAGRPGASDAELYEGIVASCAFNRGLGFQTAWVLEHHFSDYYPTPDPMTLLAYLAARFPDLSLGTCVIVTPWHDPLRLAEQVAMLSVLSQQPLHLGLGRGTAKLEYDALGVDMSQARRRFQECYEILRNALSGSPFTYKGEYLRVPKRIRVRPTPNRDRINLYGAVTSPESAGIMGGLGLLPMCTSIGDWEKQSESITDWHAAAKAAGHDHSEASIPILVDTIVADSDEEALDAACEYKPRYFRAAIDHYTPYLTEWEQAGYAAHRAIFEGMRKLTRSEGIISWADWQLIGSPRTVTAKLERFIEIGFNSFILVFASPGVPIEVRHRWAESFARKVAPNFSSSFNGGARPSRPARVLRET